MPLLMVPLARTPLWVLALLTFYVLKRKYSNGTSSWEGRWEPRTQRSVLRKQNWMLGVPHSTNLNPWKSPLLNLTLEFNPLFGYCGQCCYEQWDVYGPSFHYMCIFNRQMDKEDTVHLHNGVLCHHQKGWIPNFCIDVDGTGGDYAEWNILNSKLSHIHSLIQNPQSYPPVLWMASTFLTVSIRSLPNSQTSAPTSVFLAPSLVTQAFLVSNTPSLFPPLGLL